MSKKKKKIPIFYLFLSLFPVKCVRLCTYLCGLVHFSYLLLCISLWLRVSIYYDTMRRYTSIPLLLLSHHVKSVVLGSTQSSLLISTTFLLLQPLSSPLSQVSSHLPANSSLVNTFSHKFTSHSTDSTSLPLSCACLPHYPLHSALLSPLNCYFFITVHISISNLSMCPLTIPPLRPQHPTLAKNNNTTHHFHTYGKTTATPSI